MTFDDGTVRRPSGLNRRKRVFGGVDRATLLPSRYALSPPGRRVAVRRDYAKPLFEDLQRWLEASLAGLPGKSALAEAIRHAIAWMKRMRAYLENGVCALDNNAADMEA